jgi:hypothetical protein
MTPAVDALEGGAILRFAAGAVKRIDPRPTGSKVRRCSIWAQTPKAYVAWSRDEYVQAMGAFRYWLSRQAKPPKAKNRGPGHVAAEVFQMLARRAWRFAGRLDTFSLTAIAREIGRSKSAVVRALKALAAHQWLEWDRQWEHTGAQGRRGPQVEQTFNCYRLKIPAAALQSIGWRVRTPPPPDDHATARAAGEAANAACESDLAAARKAAFLAQLDALPAVAAANRQLQSEPESGGGAPPEKRESS